MRISLVDINLRYPSAKGERRDKMGEFNPINSQEELDAIIKNRIDRERKANAEKYADYEELKNASANYESNIATLKQALEEANTKIAEHNTVVDGLNARISAYEVKETKTRIAKEVGLDMELADRITGTDEDAMRKDAESLANIFKSHATPLAVSEPIATGNPNDEKVALKKVVGELFN